MNGGQFITDIAVVSSKDKCPNGYTIINVTISGHDANLYEGSFLKGGERYLCFARVQNSPTIVTDLSIFKEKDPITSGFTAVKTCVNDASEKSLRKHVFGLKKQNIQAAANGLINIVAIQPSKGERFQGNYFTISHEVNGINICYQTMPNSNARQPPLYPAAMSYRPPNVQANYPGGGQANPYLTGGHHMPVPVSLQGTAPQVPNEPSSPSRKHTSAIQGVSFHVNPKFELLWKKPKLSEKTVGNRSIGDIEKKYGYTFETERNILSSR